MLETASLHLDLLAQVRYLLRVVELLQTKLGFRFK